MMNNASPSTVRVCGRCAARNTFKNRLISMTIFNSRDEKYKSPFGAVSCGTTVSFTVTPGPDYCACALVTFGEFAGCREETPLTPCPDGFSGIFAAPADAELVWYTFRLTRRDGGCVFLGRNGLGDAADRQPWQLTVYEDRPTPEWFGQGVTYQIFPDRFCRLAVPDSGGMLGQRMVHENWDEPPRLGPDPQTGRWNSDFFGGSLAGICSKLDYLQSLSVTTLYLNPIFYAASCHRYDTADYSMIDPMLGTEEDLRTLCAEAEKRGIRVMLDGVFNHTGDDSRYFNRHGFFDTPGAYQSKESPWFDWFCFQHWPDKYDAWWGIDTLPAVNESAPSYRDFIIRGEDSVIRRWLRCGVSGWRLDVADELPDDFIQEIRAAMEQEKPGSYLLGEVWEDGSNKIAYSRRRRYLLGRETHSLMNYPLRTAALDYLRGGSAAAFRDTMEQLRENYPPAAFYGGLNILGTHDTPRILTLLGADAVPQDKAMRAAFRLSPAAREKGLRRLTLAAMLLYTFPGSPTVYYGDEAGLEGFEDPMNRRTYPWGREEPRLLALYRTLGALRRRRPSLQKGDITYLTADGGLLIYSRRWADEVTYTLLNTGSLTRAVTLPWPGAAARDAVSLQQFLVRDGQLHLELPPCDGLVLI